MRWQYSWELKQLWSRVKCVELHCALASTPVRLDVWGRACLWSVGLALWPWRVGRTQSRYAQSLCMGPLFLSRIQLLQSI